MTNKTPMEISTPPKRQASVTDKTNSTKYNKGMHEYHHDRQEKQKRKTKQDYKNKKKTKQETIKTKKTT